MKVKELIDKLNKVENKEQEVMLFDNDNWLSITVEEFIINSGHILLGKDIPCEMYEFDYKYA